MKGIAVPYIIALILGIVIIGLLGYLLFVLGGQVGGTGTAQTCAAKQAAWCQQWSVTGFSGGTCPTTQAIAIGKASCANDKDATDAWIKFAPGCTGVLPSKEFCQASFGQSAQAVSCIVDPANGRTDDSICKKISPSMSCDIKTGICV
jgi:hypothetical protein